MSNEAILVIYLENDTERIRFLGYFLRVLFVFLLEIAEE